MTLFEALFFAAGWFLMGAGVAILGIGIYHLVNAIRLKRRMLSFIERMKSDAPEFIKDQIEKGSGRETSEMTFRDKEGVLNTIKIIVDHDLPDVPFRDREDFYSMVVKGETGRINDIPEKAMVKVQEFIFSPQAVRNMRRDGIEPDEVVTKMLKASGRME